ncbi:MAG TPA: MFS transporter [Polyangiaceae bacterium]|nr:MFS transporter [Polyangiaceae bacterium]
MANTEAARPMSADEKRVIFASSLGTVFEWYDFYLFGVLTAIIGAQFFAPLDEATRNIFTLLAFAAGFAVRPFGALVFGRLGDLVGRKYTFLITILIMGLSTFALSFLPGYKTLGIAAPIILIALRLLQGLALGGEYGGAATYVAEHAPNGRRGLYTSWIQTTATVGLMLALMVILAARFYSGGGDFTPDGEKAFAQEWGAWRIPFACSALLLAVSVWIRVKLSESPAFLKIKAEGKVSKAPLKESFGEWKNLRIVLLALFGLTAGQAVVWYTGQFYALYFLQTFLKVDGPTANVLIAVSLILGTPFFLICGAVSDRIGRKPVIMAGLLLAALTYFPLFHALTSFANPKLQAAIEKSPVTVVSAPEDCNLVLNLTGTAKFTTPCDVSRTWLSNAGVNYDKVDGPAGTPATVKIGDKSVVAYDAKAANAKDEKARFEKEVRAALTAAGYPAKADKIEAFSGNWIMLVILLTIMVIYVTMVYGPIAAMLVEMFPTRIRYTSMSLPYHIGNGWFGGFLPAVSFSIVAAKGNIYSGLWYPIVIAVVTFIIGMLFVKETKDSEVYHQT